MSDETIKNLEKRVADLESKLTETKKPPRAPREPSEYNKFVAEYITKNKDPKKQHKDLFAEAVKAWNTRKK